MREAVRTDAGFTLVEALVSLFVFSLVAAGAVLMLGQSVATQGRVQDAQAALREVQNTRALLIGDLSQYVGREVRAADGSVRPRLIGGDAEMALAFVRASAEPSAEGRPATRVALVEYTFVDDKIIRRTRANLDDGGAAMTERVIVADAEAARFEFYDGISWREQWLVGSAGSAPPRAVALVFTSRRYGEVRIEALVGLGA